MAIVSAADTGYCQTTRIPRCDRCCRRRRGIPQLGGKLGPHPFPAGLNDCAAGVRWAAANRAELGITHLIVSGESGGGNLTLTVAHKAKREGWLHEIAGFYAQCPYDLEPLARRMLTTCRR